MKKVIKLFFTPILNRYYDLNRRIQNLEIINNTLLLDNEWVDDKSKFLNGQEHRQKIFFEIIKNFNIKEVIETGTFIGRTTGFFAKYLESAIINTCEISPQFHALAKLRLQKFKNIRFYCLDSRNFLTTIENKNENDHIFIYLDAHWHSDLPLKEELEIISKRWKKAIIMIDDFEVLGDEGYIFDDYGKGKRLCFNDYHNVFQKFHYKSFSSSVISHFETGRKRGCVILTQDPLISLELNKFSTLKPSII